MTNLVVMSQDTPSQFGASAAAGASSSTPEPTPSVSADADWSAASPHQPATPNPQHQPDDHGWWQPRPSGALSDPVWTGTHPAARGQRSSGTQQFPGPAGWSQYAPTGSYGTSGGGYGTWSGSSTGYGTPGSPGGVGGGPVGPQGGASVAIAERPARRRTMTTVAAAGVLALVAGFGGGLIGSNLADSNAGVVDNSLTRASSSATVSDTSAPEGSVQQVAETVLPSVVSVLAGSATSQGEGSGVILSSDGLILTNNHVINGATQLQVRFNDGTTADATVIGTDPTDDLAVIKAVNVSGLTAATLGSSDDLQVGQEVVAIGSPLGLSATVTSGIVSALDRPVRTGSAQQEQQSPFDRGQSTTTSQDTVMNAIQTDAAINPGNSGGALVDMNGAVIGINSAIASTASSGEAGNIGVGFAIPIDQAKRIAQEIIETGQATHAVLGASVQDASVTSEGEAGATIAQVTAGGGAEAAGLQAGDVVTKLDDQLVESADGLIAAVRSADPGSTVTVTYLRKGETETVDVQLGSSTS
ncbi:S1C family serine protease [Nakamurella leprariae]|uniref:Trypsin-like peptidase domain-containing protein n=1 Tax=Nakamurella leprariae TaxID=2803911 RepID=A0A939C2N8_9ACTN|nr:trypsin-like peptidase domain-containing protein [Nakamurella leprariae]MBM9468474.1 trypsin-like peptidase domain-containing protein [Nakamurella leprariae]